MIRSICVNGMTLEKGMLKICVPVCGTSLDEVLWEIRDIKTKPVDIIEWRMDSFNEDAISAMRKVKEEVGDIPLLITLRTKGEGGHKEISKIEYVKQISEIIRSKKADIIDIELSVGDEKVQELIALAREKSVLTVLSAHFFHHTPEKAELLEKFKKMEELGADLPKIAVMPKSFSDVLILMEVAYEASRENFPIIAVSMGKMGKITRLCGKEMGSAITFASGKISSAPGQIKASLISKLL